MKLFKLFCYHIGSGTLWFRIFGYGLHFKNLDKKPLVFSERIDMTKTFRIYKYSIKTLKRCKF